MVICPTFGATETSSEPFSSGKVIPEGSMANPQKNVEKIFKQASPPAFEQSYLHNGLHNDPKGQFGELNTGWSYRVERWERR